MSDEVKMPDPKVEAADFCERWHIAEDGECVAQEFRSLMARTLRAAAKNHDLPCNIVGGNCAATKCLACNFEQELERMASEIEKGK